MGSRTRTLIILAVLAAVALSALPAMAEPVGIFTKVEGSVDILRRSDISVAPVRVGDPVSMGDAVRTKRTGKAEIQFRDETVVQLAPETRITIDEYTYRGTDQREKGLLSLFRGKVRAIVSKIKAAVVPVVRSEASFNIKTPTAIAGVKGTQLIVYYERGVTGVIFLDGIGTVHNPDRPERIVPVKAGQASFVMQKTDPPLDAQPVAESFVAPYLKDFPGAGPAASGAAAPSATQVTTVQPAGPSQAAAAAVKTEAGGTQQQAAAPSGYSGGYSAGYSGGTTVNVVQANTTYQALSNTVADAGPIMAPAPVTGPVIVGASLPPTVAPPTIPITETQPQLLPVPVTVSITIP